ncbi:MULTISPECIES: NAD(P)/FAD-dependent oxidoreductase [unclassified Halanaerobium]|uniref:dihydrolipoyl dehydrogenase family protein n=1 Tax=unclassified Halanaerobium TaxID=2641197 RepID=UPI000DF35B65|nr:MULTISPECIES: NAD(P)/FAD-dependent oxidoreductase [unclassified Halanaerobium]RCW51521.1 pyruvate/2-oxoglutarate dehydrogenase complex dihydrolipoamide dehydrogenase (E3) component [Halanaerobium sp. MA284_MarDTE_T2]RCW89309.1 pyruvate/2-oxoglutarate dehydrogenase complex dihydrolipoamide dehydrogenase (E3) component [Halanaerobium sp. DL-01]
MKKYDLIVIGMGPAGMAVTAMASNMDLNVLAIEKHKVGGECLNYGCVPSKALLKAGEVNEITENLRQFGIQFNGDTEIENPLEIVREKVGEISGNKTMKAFERADLIIDKGEAKFVDKKIVEVDGERYTADKIFIATGTEPLVPPIPGLKDVSLLTNLNIFAQEDIPKKLTIIGGGAIGSEMAQAFSRLGSEVNMFQIDDHLVPIGDEEAGRVLEEKFKKEGIGVYNSTGINKVEEKDRKIIIHTEAGVFESNEILVATGRKIVLDSLNLENAGIEYGKGGIKVNRRLETNVKGIYAVGDCNGKALLSHAAMHQGMIALMNAINPTPIKQFNYDDFLVPWSVFTKPEIAQVGVTEKEAEEKGLDYQIVKENYSDYGRTIADGKPEGFVKVITNSKGKVFGATIVGEAASELIHEWILAIQHDIGLFDIMMTQHSFPTISLMNKRVAEKWMMGKTNSGFISKLAKKFI